MLDQFRGCLLGLACGDALGAPLEFMSAADIRSKHGVVTEMLGGGWLHLRPGQVTDDTQMMLCILESHTETGGFDPQDIADRFAEWYIGGPPDIGNLTRSACELLRQGYNFERAGEAAWRTAPENARLGNGSLMRCAPTALFRYHDELRLIGESRVISGITHWDECCKLACVVQNLAIAHLMLVGVDGLLDELLEFIAPRNATLGAALRAIPGLRTDELRTTGYVVDTLQSALWTVIYVESFEEGLTLVVNRGDDADTVGAVAGALLGARFGVDSIPARWLEVLQYRQRIERAAERLFQVTMQS
jgi:ADP-ribosyl-[dinitrogen reductase] hydrolase